MVVSEAEVVTEVGDVVEHHLRVATKEVALPMAEARTCEQRVASSD